MPSPRPIDVPLLFELWHDTSLTQSDVARRLGVSVTLLGRLARRHKLEQRPKQVRCNVVDPTPDEIAKRAAECRAKHMAARLAEDAAVSSHKASCWRRGICVPRGGR
jgi:hypothetical protein